MILQHAALNLGRRLAGRPVKNDASAMLLSLYERGQTKLKRAHDPWVVRHLSDEALHRQIVSEPTMGDDAAALAMLEREARRREAWDGPAGRAFWISLGAMGISIGSLVLTALRSH